MVKYYARVGQTEYEIEIDGDAVYVDGERLEVDLRQSGVPELYSMLFNARSYELLIEPERFNYRISLRGEHFDVQVEDERTRRLNAGRKTLALPEGELAVTAPIPGLVVKVLVAPGDAIEEEQPLVILEAMKMENEIRAVRSGVVKKVEVAPGQRVEQNGLLLTLE
ncbi:MAG: acetyl-CoA carboxylase biotin carboxyl carrier protein subunit [Litorilinea sp.]|nr:MAG: acetyl-CoA carboxylase biotin carboxyl carrier protein subunit [Litorilinea sp.]